jgi:hypothetical protein
VPLASVRIEGPSTRLAAQMVSTSQHSLDATIGLVNFRVRQIPHRKLVHVTDKTTIGGQVPPPALTYVAQCRLCRCCARCLATRRDLGQALERPASSGSREPECHHGNHAESCSDARVWFAGTDGSCINRGKVRFRISHGRKSISRGQQRSDHSLHSGRHLERID